MQLVYLDEAGISNKAHEPHLVVAGVIVNPDEKWKDLERYFADFTAELFPEHVNVYGRHLIFHAKDIWHGSGKFDRSQWSREERMKILTRLARVPKQFELPVIYGHVDQNEAEHRIQSANPKATRAEIQNMVQSAAFFRAVSRVEKWMEESAPDQVAMLIAEDTDRVKEMIGHIHASYTDRTQKPRPGVFQSNHIVDTVYFAKKQDSIILQIADHCAFLLKRHFMGCRHSDELVAEIAPQVASRTSGATAIQMIIPRSDLKPL